MNIRIFRVAVSTILATVLSCGISFATLVAIPTAAASTITSSTNTTTSRPELSGKVTLSASKGVVGDTVSFTVTGLNPSQSVKLMWGTESGAYQLSDIYHFDQPVYTKKEDTLLTGTSDSSGTWTGKFEIPKGFGGDHTLFAEQNSQDMAQTNVYVAPFFDISPKSGPVGTPITITAEGIGATSMDSNWELTYDNKMTGLISAVSTDGSAKAVIRAAGDVGTHTLTIWHGWMGMPYVNYTQAPDAYLPVPTFSFDVTSNEPATSDSSTSGNYVEPVPASAANGGIVMPKLQFAKGVTVSLSQSEGTVGQPVTLNAHGLPANQSVSVIWNTMTGSRVSGHGFTSKQETLAHVKTDGSGNFTYPFKVPDDLGGVPHRIDLTIGGKIVGQAYLRILPSIVSVTPTSGSAGTKVTVELKGVGWTEYDNTYYITYDNAYVGYVCGFNSSGTVKFTLTASGEPGYHIIDLYPGIYRGQKPLPNIYNAPQLTYGSDHPGDAIPAIRMGFNITK